MSGMGFMAHTDPAGVVPSVTYVPLIFSTVPFGPVQVTASTRLHILNVHDAITLSDGHRTKISLHVELLGEALFVLRADRDVLEVFELGLVPCLARSLSVWAEVLCKCLSTCHSGPAPLACSTSLSFLHHHNQSESNATRTCHHTRQSPRPSRFLGPVGPRVCASQASARTSVGVHVSTGGTDPATVSTQSLTKLFHPLGSNAYDSTHGDARTLTTPAQPRHVGDKRKRPRATHPRASHLSTPGNDAHNRAQLCGCPHTFTTPAHPRHGGTRQQHEHQHSRAPIAKECAGPINEERLADAPAKQAQALLDCGGKIGNMDVDSHEQALTLHRSVTTSGSWPSITTHPQLLSPTHVLASMHLQDGNALASLPARVRNVLHEKGSKNR